MSEVWCVPEEDVTCAICLTCWIEKDPILLNCSHTFCCKCIQDLLKYNGRRCIFTCPSCRKPHSLLSPDVSKLPRNIMFANAYKKDPRKENDKKNDIINDEDLIKEKEEILSKIDNQVKKFRKYLENSVDDHKLELNNLVEDLFQEIQREEMGKKTALKFNIDSDNLVNTAHSKIFKQTVKSVLKFVGTDLNLGKIRRLEKVFNFDLTSNSKINDYDDIRIRGIFFLNASLYSLEEPLDCRTFRIIKQDFNLENEEIFYERNHELTNAFVDKDRVYMNDFSDPITCRTVKFDLQAKHVKKCSVSKFLPDLQNFRSVGHKDVVATNKSHIMRIKNGKVIWNESGFRSLSEILILKDRVFATDSASNNIHIRHLEDGSIINKIDISDPNCLCQINDYYFLANSEFHKTIILFNYLGEQMDTLNYTFENIYHMQYCPKAKRLFLANRTMVSSVHIDFS